MNSRHETVKMIVPPGNHAESRETRTRGLPYSTSQGSRPEDGQKDAHLCGRSGPIDELSGLRLTRPALQWVASLPEILSLRQSVNPVFSPFLHGNGNYFCL